MGKVKRGSVDLEILPQSAHRRLQSAIKDAPLMRGGADFADLPVYRRFIDNIVNERRQSGEG